MASSGLHLVGRAADGPGSVRCTLDPHPAPLRASVWRTVCCAATVLRQCAGCEPLGPAVAASAFITGYDTATMRAVLQTDPAVTGTYEVTFHLFGGSSATHRINTR